MLAVDAVDRYWIGGNVKGRPRLKEVIEDKEVDMVGMRDDWSGMIVKVRADKAFASWRFPVETVSQSEFGIERTYQGSCIALLFDINFNPSKPIGLTIRLEVEKAR
jgi:alpha-amylase